MPRRIREIQLDNLIFRIGSFSLNEVEEYIKQSKELVDRQPPPSNDDWMDRTVETVAKALNNASAKEEWTVERIKAEMDIPLINFIYKEFTKFTGLRAEEPGEVVATSTSR